MLKYLVEREGCRGIDLKAVGHVDLVGLGERDKIEGGR